MLSGAANDLAGALATIDAYTGTPPRVTGVNVLLKLRRGADQAFMRSVRAARPASGPASACAPGSRSSASAAARFTRNYTFRVPSDARTGSQRVRFVGTDADEGDSGFTTIILGGDDERDEGGDPGPATLRELADAGRGHRALRRRQRPHRPRPRRGVPRRRLPHLRPGRGHDRVALVALATLVSPEGSNFRRAKSALIRSKR